MIRLRYLPLLFLLFLSIAPLSLAQDRAPAYCQAGNRLYNQKKYDEAIRYYEAALQVNARMWEAYQGEGNCYYAKGDSDKSLAFYQRSLNLHPDNPSLATFVQSLRDKMKQANATPDTPSTIEKELLKERQRIIDRATDPHWELSLGFGPAASALGTGWGGTLSGFQMFNARFGLGLILRYYGFGDSITYGSIPYTTASNTTGSYSETFTDGVSCLDLGFSIKFRFKPRGLKLYLLGGGGVVYTSTTSATTFNYLNGPPTYYYQYYNHSGTNSGLNLEGQAGFGAELGMGESMNIFLQISYIFILSQQDIPAYGPLEAGVDFRL